MIFISHRGNINGPNPERENSFEYINEAVKAGYDVEIDFWVVKNELFLGHDEPQYKFKQYEEFNILRKNLWVHCKNIEALYYFNYWNRASEEHYFWHQEDDFTLTNRNYIWTYPGKKIMHENQIAVMPERFPDWDISLAGGICSDYISKYKESHG